MKAKINIITKRTFEIWLIYSSKRPTLVLTCLEFIWERVSLPVKITKAIIEPAANTVFAQAVLSKFKDYFLPSLLVKLPKKS